MDESKKVERELVAIQERQVQDDGDCYEDDGHNDADNEHENGGEDDCNYYPKTMLFPNDNTVLPCESLQHHNRIVKCILNASSQAAGDIYIHSLLTDLQTAETEGAELQVVEVFKKSRYIKPCETDSKK